MNGARGWTPRAFDAWNRFFHAPVDPSVCGLFRIGYASLLLLNMLVLLPELTQWFGEEGVLPLGAAQAVIDRNRWTLFQWLPQNDGVVWACYLVFLAQIVGLGLGFFSRFNAVCVFLWLVSFQHRNRLLFDGEDNVFRLMGFFLIFLPLGKAYAIDAARRVKRGLARHPPAPEPAWALRLVQLQMCLIFVSTALEKLRGAEWLDGSAVYYVTRLDVYRFGPLPDNFLTSTWAMKAATWGVLAAECIVPIAVWIPGTRRLALGVAVAMHLAMAYAMNLFLFQWIMILGWLTFLTPDEVHVMGAWLRRQADKMAGRKNANASVGTG